MMILSRIWYVILALLLAAAYYVVALSVGQYNRRNQAAMEETLKADAQVVSWALQVDARRRLDVMFLAAGDQAVGKAIRAANGKDAVPQTSRDEGAKALRAFNEKLPADYRSDALFVTDREGRLVAQVGYDSVNGLAEFELGGYPAVFDALHGFLRDDTWVWGGKIARVVARPVEDEVGQPPIGAVIGLRWVDTTFAKEMGKRTRTNLAFFALGTRVASAAVEDGGLDGNILEALDLKNVAEDKGFKENGRTDLQPLTMGPDEKGGILYVRMPGDAWELGGGFAVARPRVAITSPTEFISGADDKDKKNVKMPIAIGIAVGALFFGLLFSFLEHSMPLKEMKRQAEKLKKGEIDVLQLPRFRGGYRPIATDINAGIQRVVEKGGGNARKPADLESILGPVPAQPNMSAFSFPLPDGSVAQPVPQPPFPGPPGPPVPSAPGSVANRFPPSPGSGPRPGPPGAPPPPNARPAPPPPAPAYGDRTMAMNPNGPSATNGPALAPPPPAFLPKNDDGEEEEATMVAQPPADLISAATGASNVLDPQAEWHAVYEEFIRTKRECGEPTDGLTFEKFQQTLKKNRDALMQRHGCKRVKFSVYVKEGRASLKATPVRE